MKKGFLPLVLCLCIGMVAGCTGSREAHQATPTRTATVKPSPTSAPPTQMMEQTPAAEGAQPTPAGGTAP